MVIMVEIEEGKEYLYDPRQVANSTYFLLSEEIKDYLGFKLEDRVLIRFKADKGKRGRYIGVWLELDKRVGRQGL